ncbi:hypothetical protein GCM10010094_63240 [Streptomyces flaveus]|uniref:Uncharacterized protein n=1 Tax=Streptomyces flaveus TaxID=66370 RepID=A0A917R774_9ACTN|nr:hypothetical protein GCM10010094_63240 [Streptomyces flaveus]
MRVGVTRKTIDRWLADEHLVPHARNRIDAAQALGVDEEMIWPLTVKDRLKTGTELLVPWCLSWDSEAYLICSAANRRTALQPPTLCRVNAGLEPAGGIQPLHQMSHHAADGS